MMVYSSHGRGRPTVTSNKLEPIEDDTAMPPLPSLATSTEVIRSGTEVPAARKVRPITASLIPMVSPARVAHHTMKYENTAIQTMLTMKAMGKNFFLFSSWGLGMVIHIGTIRGSETNHMILEIGLNADHDNGKWVWPHRNTTVEWFDWARGQPNDWENENCLTLLEFHDPFFPQARDYFWNDWKCGETAHYICEKTCNA